RAAMAEGPTEITVAGHICLDIIPRLGADQTTPSDLFAPGQVLAVGPATVALGGAVANTGLALHHLGANTRLMGKLGDDLLGGAVLNALRQVDQRLAAEMIVSPGEATSYSIVMSPPGVDRY